MKSAKRTVLILALMVAMLMTSGGVAQAATETVIWGPGTFKTQTEDQNGIPNATISYIATETNVYLKVNTEGQYYYTVSGQVNSGSTGTSYIISKPSGSIATSTQVDIRNVFVKWGTGDFRPDNRVATIASLEVI